MTQLREWAVGYDGNGYAEGDRVELHPGTDWWMSGSRYGTVEWIRRRVVRLDGTEHVRVRVRLANGRFVTGTDETFRAIPETVTFG